MRKKIFDCNEMSRGLTLYIDTQHWNKYILPRIIETGGSIGEIKWLIFKIIYRKFWKHHHMFRGYNV